MSDDERQEGIAAGTGLRGKSKAGGTKTAEETAYGKDFLSDWKNRIGKGHALPAHTGKLSGASDLYDVFDAADAPGRAEWKQLLFCNGAGTSGI